MPTAGVRECYLPAASLPRTAAASSSSSSSVSYTPTREECGRLADPIARFLAQHRCYDLLSISTQVVVVDVRATLSVAFIAAQETRLQSCVLWDPRPRALVDVLTSVDYITALLFCGCEADARGEGEGEGACDVSVWTIARWLAVREAIEAFLRDGREEADGAPAETGGRLGRVASWRARNPGVFDPAAGDASAAATTTSTSRITTCETETTLTECLDRMRRSRTRQILVLSGRREGDGGESGPGGGGSNPNSHPNNPHPHRDAAASGVVAVLDVEQLVAYLGGLFFHLEKSSEGLWGEGAGAGAAGAGENASDAPDDDEDGEWGGNPSVRDADGAAEGDANGKATTAAARAENPLPGDGEELPILGLYHDATLPANISAIIETNKVSGAAGGEPRVGPYHSLFDIPFENLPEGIAALRSRAVYVTMEQTLREALLRMLKYDMESIAVCDSDRLILKVISCSDLLRMENHGVYDINVTVREAVSGKTNERVFVFYKTDTVREIFTHFVRRRVKVLFMVDPETGVLQGQLSVSEFVFFLVNGRV